MTPLELVGVWSLTREIDDRRAVEHLRVTGTTVLAAESPDRVVWHEEGLLHRVGRPATPVHRTLAVVRRHEGWWVVFEHGGDFHPWTPGTWVEHPCGADVYRGRVETGADAWSVVWSVTGPTKDYTTTSRLKRSPSRRTGPG